jgi:hypothetical protein
VGLAVLSAEVPQAGRDRVSSGSPLYHELYVRVVGMVVALGWTQSMEELAPVDLVEMSLLRDRLARLNCT